MAYGGLNKYVDAAVEIGRDSVSTRSRLSIENEQADAVRDCRIHLARPNIRHERGQGNVNFSCSADHVQDWQPYQQVDPYSC